MLQLILEFLAEVVCQVIAEVILGGLDWFSWKKGRPNRIIRRQAKYDGMRRPRRDRWNWFVLILTPIVIMLGVLIIVAYIVRFH